MKTLKDDILRLLKKSGINDASFCAFLPLLPYLIDCRAKERIPQNAKTVITCFFPYKVKAEPPKNISRYAAVPDYHRVLEPFLFNATNNLRKAFPNNKFEYFIDNSPIPEVRACALSGLGVVGDNGLLITKEYGSFVFLAEIVTNLFVETCDNIEYCLHCGVCKKSCPKESIGKCLSAVTQQKKDLNDKEIECIKKNNTLWGCDLCAEKCPLNVGKKTTYIKQFIDGYKNEYVLGENIIGRAYEWRGEKVILRNKSFIDD